MVSAKNLYIFHVILVLHHLSSFVIFIFWFLCVCVENNCIYSLQWLKSNLLGTIDVNWLCLFCYVLIFQGENETIIRTISINIWIVYCVIFGWLILTLVSGLIWY